MKKTIKEIRENKNETKVLKLWKKQHLASSKTKLDSLPFKSLFDILIIKLTANIRSTTSKLYHIRLTYITTNAL